MSQTSKDVSKKETSTKIGTSPVLRTRGILEGSSFLSGFLLAADRKTRGKDGVKDPPPPPSPALAQHSKRGHDMAEKNVAFEGVMKCRLHILKTMGQLVVGDKNREPAAGVGVKVAGGDHPSLRGARMCVRPPPPVHIGTLPDGHLERIKRVRGLDGKT